MPFTLTPKQLKLAVSEAHDQEAAICAPIGLFTRWFAASEHQITRLLAHVLDMRNFEKFEILAAGLLPRQKVLKLREIVALSGTVDVNFAKRLTYFEVNCIPLRNLIAHSYPILLNNKIHFASVARMPEGYEDVTRPSANSPSSYEINEINRRALWMRDFCHDLDYACVETWHQRPLVIANPKSSLPPTRNRAATKET